MNNKNENIISISGIGKIPTHAIEKLNEKLEECYDIPLEPNKNNFEDYFGYKAPCVLECIPRVRPFDDLVVKGPGDRKVKKKAISKRRKRNKNRKTHR